jgi:FKBP-type peptidyl-prolyl cis-trans isomerase FkpA
MSTVTAVPLQPLPKGSVVKLWIGVVLLCLAAGALAWYGTRGQQLVDLPSGARMRVLGEGTGPTMTDADVMLLSYRLHVNDLAAPVLQDSEQVGGGQPFPATTSQVYPGFADALRHMKAGGRYIIWLPPGTHVSGPIPPGAGFTARDTLVFEIRTGQLAAGMAQELQRQQMMQLQQQMQEQMQAQQQGAHPGSPHPTGGDAGASGASGGAAPSGRHH